MTIKIKIISGFFLSIAAMLLITVSSLSSADKLATNTKWVSHTYEVLIVLEQVLSQLKDTETGQRGYLVTGKKSYLAPYYTGKIDAIKSLDKLQKLTSDNSVQQERIKKIRPLIKAKFDELAETIELRRVEGFDAALAVVLSDKGKVVMDQIRGLLDAMVADEKVLMEKRSSSTTSSAKKMITVTAVISSIVILLIAFFITKSITHPLNETVVKINALTKGDLTVEINDEANDEIGEMSKALKQFAFDLRETLSQIQEQSNSLSDSSGKLSSVSSNMSSATVEMSSQTDSISASSNEMSQNFETIASASTQMAANVDSVASAATEMNVSIESIASASTQMDSNISSIAGTATDMSSNMEQVNVEVKEMSLSFEQVFEEATNVTQISNQAKSLSEKGSKVLAELGDSANEIDQVTGLIKTIASQTNMLALNATIESASAGQAGKGFAVVAGEVKELATKSTQAAENIFKKISGIQ